jgi:amino acid permease
MRSRRVYLTSVFALFVIAASVFLLDYVSFFEGYYGFDKLTYKASDTYQNKMKPVKFISALLFFGSLIGIILCSLTALKHTAALRVSTKTITAILCLTIMTFVLLIIGGIFQ